MVKKQPFLLLLIQTVSKMPLAFLQSFGALVALVFYHFSQAKTLKCAELNLKIALPDLSESELEYIRKQSAINEVKSYCEFISIWGTNNTKNIKRIHRIVGEEYLNAAITNKKGLVLVVPHFGTWEIMNCWISQFTELTIMYKPSKNAEADAFVKAARSRENANLVPTNESGVREIFKALKRGGTTVILPDHSPDNGNELTPWFGVPLYSSHLSAKLIKKTKANALLLYAIRNNDGGFDLTIEPIDDNIYTSDTGTEIIHQTVEALIRKYPEHYHWSYKRFQASPATAGIYDCPQNEALQRIEKIRKNSTTQATCNAVDLGGFSKTDAADLH